MGEIAEMMLDGTLCQVCGEFMGDDRGFPRTCAGCEKPVRRNVFGEAPMKVKCPTCGKKVKHNGLADHTRVVHHVAPSGERR